MFDLEREVERLNYDLEEDMVRITPLVDGEHIRFDGLNILLSKGVETEVPLWIAEILEKKGMAEIVLGSKGPTHNILRSISRKENNSPTLTELDKLMYRRVRMEIDKLSKEGTTMSLRRLTSIEGSLNNILRLRSRKILGLVRDDERQAAHSNLTAEEEWLLRQLNETYVSWKNRIGFQSTRDKY